MSQWIQTKGALSCKICQNCTGHCRQSSNGKTLLCMNYDKIRQIPSQYKFTGVCGDAGTWGKFVEQKQKTPQTSEQNLIFQREQAQLWAKRQQEEQEKAARLTSTMIPADRHLYYTQLFSELTLDPEDHQDLRRRGLSEQEITQGGFKSVEQWQPLQQHYPNHLPGIQNNTRLIIPEPGYACPIKDVNGYIVAFQTRARSPQDPKQRYKWITGITVNNPQGYSAHLSNGELPLAVHRPPKLKKFYAIGLTEGTGVKPFIASLRLGQIVVGGGGSFMSSPQTLESTLAALSQELGTQKIDFYPDRGSAINLKVWLKYEKTFEFLASLNYEVKVANWGHLTSKDNPDIDELSDYQGISFITPDEFIKIAETHAPKPDILAKALQMEDFSPLPSLPERTNAATISIAELCSQRVQSVIQSNPTDPDFKLFALAVREVYGWNNWLIQKNIPRFDSPTPLIDRIAHTMSFHLKSDLSQAKSSIDPQPCVPGLFHQGGDLRCWLKLKSLNSELYLRLAPDDIKAEAGRSVRIALGQTADCIKKAAPKIRVPDVQPSAKKVIPIPVRKSKATTTKSSPSRQLSTPAKTPPGLTSYPPLESFFFDVPNSDRSPPSIEALRTWYKLSRYLSCSQVQLDQISQIASQFKQSQTLHPTVLDEMRSDFTRYCDRLHSVYKNAQTLLIYKGARGRDSELHFYRDDRYEILASVKKQTLTILQSSDQKNLFHVEQGKVTQSILDLSHVADFQQYANQIHSLLKQKQSLALRL